MSDTQQALQQAAQPAAQPTAQGEDSLQGRLYVRPYQPSDKSDVEQLVRHGAEECIGQADKWTFTSPFFLPTVLALGLGIDVLLGVHKVPVTSVWENAKYLVGPAALALALILATNWHHNVSFPAKARATIGQWEEVPIEKYYETNLNTMSGAWVFDYKGVMAGMVMLDARGPGKELDSAAGVPSTSSSTSEKGVTTDSKSGTTAELRHLAVIPPYRRHGVGTELLGAALDVAFGLTPGHNESNDAGRQATVTRVIALTSPFTPGGDALWTKMGFVRVPDADVTREGWRTDTGMGALKWKGHWVAVDREAWIKAREGLYSRFAPAVGEEQGEGHDVAPDGTLIGGETPVPPPM